MVVDVLGWFPPPDEFGPGAFADFPHAIIGQPFSFNVLANDALGGPPAMITQVVGFDGPNGCTTQFSFDQATGVISGTAIPGGGSCGPFTYTLSNPAGQSSTTVLITTSPPEEFGPGVFADFPHAIIGQPFSFNVLANDAVLGSPPATITQVVGFDGPNGCTTQFSFDQATGVISGTAIRGGGSCGPFTYTLSNPAGQSSTTVFITVTFN